MTRHRLNVRLIATAAGFVCVLAACTHFTHAWQMHRHARAQLARADAALEAGEVKEATKSLGRSAAFHPDLQVRTRHAMMLAEQAKSNRARYQAFVALTAVLPPYGGDLGVRLKAVELAQSLDNPQEVCRLLRAAVDDHPDRTDLAEAYFRAQEAAGKPLAAIETLEKALAYDGSRANVASNLSRLYRGQRQPKKAAAVLERLVKDNPRLPAAYLARARDRMREGKLAEADADLAVARSLDLDADVLAASAELARRQGQGDDAVRFAERAAAERPGSVPFALALAQARRDRGNTADALSAVRRALETHPDDVRLRFVSADLLYDRGDLDAAAAEAAKLPPEAKGRRLYLAARASMAKRQPWAAVKSLLRATTEPDLPPGVAGLALTRALGEVGHVREQLLAAADALPFADGPAARAELARALVANGQGKAASAALKELAKLANPPEVTWAALARVLIEENLDRAPAGRRWAEVFAALDRADRVPADEATAAVLRADAHTFLDEPAEAMRVLREARARRPDEPLLWQAEATLTARAGQDERSRKLLEAADARFTDRSEWLVNRAWRLADERGSAASAALEKLEQDAEDLPQDDRDRLARALVYVHARIENYAAVERLCARALKADPTDMQAAMMQFDARLSRNDVAGARESVARVRRLEGEDGVAWRVASASLLSRGDAKARGQARALLTSSIQARPRWSHPVVLLARLDDAEGRATDALTNYQRAFALGDYDGRSVRRAVSLLLARDRDDDADRVLEAASRAGSLHADLLRPAAEVALRVGRNDRAVTLARQATPERASHRDLLWLGRVLAAAGRPLDAESAFDESTRVAPEASEAWLGLIAFYGRQGRNAKADEATARMRQAVSPESRPLATARALDVQGRRAEAEAAYRRHLTRSPRDAEALRRLADLYLRQNEWDRAEGVLIGMLDRRLSMAEEELPPIRRRLALTLAMPGRDGDRTDDALALIEMNRETEGDVEADRRVSALVRASKTEGRAAALKELETMPGGPAVTAPERIFLARLYEAQKRWGDARHQYELAQAADKDNPTYLAVLADFLLRQDRKAEAAGWLRKLEKLEPQAERTKKLRERLVRN